QPAGTREGELEGQIDSHHRGKEDDRYRQDQRYEELLPEIPVMMVPFMSSAIMLMCAVITMTVVIMMIMVMFRHGSSLSPVQIVLFRRRQFLFNHPFMVFDLITGLGVCITLHIDSCIFGLIDCRLGSFLSFHMRSFRHHFSAGFKRCISCIRYFFVTDPFMILDRFTASRRCIGHTVGCGIEGSRDSRLRTVHSLHMLCVDYRLTVHRIFRILRS